MYLKINSILIVHSHGPDLIALDTNLPNGSFPYDSTVSLDLKVAADSAETYCKKNFPTVPIRQIVNRPKSDYNFAKK